MDKKLKDDIQISIGAGALFGFAIYLIMLRVNEGLWYLSILAGVGLAGILVIFLLCQNKFGAQRYAKAMAELGYEVKFQCVGNFISEYGKKTGNIYYCGEHIVLLGLDRKPHVTTVIHRDDVDSYSMPRVVQLDIHLKDGTTQTIHTGEVGTLCNLMKKKHWGKRK